MTLQELKEKRRDITEQLSHAPHATQSLGKQIDKAKAAFAKASAELKSLELQLEAVDKLQVSLNTDLADAAEQYLKALFSDIHAFNEVFTQDADKDAFWEDFADPVEDYLKSKGDLADLLPILLATFKTEFAKSGMKLEVTMDKVQTDEEWDDATQTRIPIFTEIYDEIWVDGEAVYLVQSASVRVASCFQKVYEKFKEKLQLEASVGKSTKETKKIKL